MLDPPWIRNWWVKITILCNSMQVYTVNTFFALKSDVIAKLHLQRLLIFKCY